MTELAQRLEQVRSLFAILGGRGRAWLMRMRGANLGRKATIGPRVIVRWPTGVRSGERFIAEPDVYLKLVGEKARLDIGDFTFLGRGTELDVLERVTIGSHTVIAPGCFITDHNHGISAGLRIDQQGCSAKPVVIGADVWLGANVVVLPGVHISDGAVIGAGSVVTRDVAPMSVVAGAPARVLRRRS
ncbi:MAG TPA: acyltransferase [Vicinamibacterales bacterium]|nr:acyltransferase [Vicinamibacterales bacterium]